MTDTTVDFSPAAAPLAEKLLPAALEVIARYPADRSRSALLPLLHLVQTEEGFVSPNGVAFCAEILGINKAQVGAVATFYTMYKRRPTGEYLVSVCTNTLCNTLGGQQVYDELSEHLGVGHDETTADGRITLEHAECLAACDYAPVVTVNYDFAIDEATPAAAVGLVDQLRNGERPTPSRGARICSLKEMQVQLAGFAEPRAGAVADGVAGAPTLRGVTLAQEHGIAVADFNPDTPITKTKPSPREESRGKVATVVDKVKSAVSSVTPGHAGKTTHAGDVKDPQTRTAEQRNPDASTPDKTGTADEKKPVPSNPAEAAGTASNEPAGDGKPAGDTARTEEAK
ncbi:NADH-quinone oxidoreductase subunit NuoE [Paractinoplanes lichenicola]|uniref:NADH-quinone oxidoreductase subunit NuoE n=1 Tax=Paractinoplanes lichenicola TaxID=2802976 RepID=A0ABS1W2H9_9ACTN|nr:NADH-quinone oxidoreductase subunit NuoE [Actinoplanes lichenicola]MBL7260936.1 NADH-quinone oxidoreductase subunit NuoE [Actinoplanes lichenicola]